MKNTIPMIIAVVLAAAAVFAVSRMIRSKDDGDTRRYVEVVSAAQNIPAGKEGIKEDWLTKRRVEVSSMPAKTVPWSQANRLVGQSVLRTIPKGDYVLLDDVEFMPRFDSLVAEGEWAVPLTFADSSLVQFMQPGMEIAVLGTFTLKQKIAKVDGSEAPDIVAKEATSVIFPCVKILDVGGGDGLRREGGGATIVVALTPQQAATLIAAQRTMELYPALRRPNDRTSLKRRDVGIVDDRTFAGLRHGLEAVVISDETKK